jgi:excisionase family DNA binding protein
VDNSPAPLLASRVYLGYAEIAAQTGISLSTLRRRVKEGRLPFIQPGGRRTRIVFPADVIERLLQNAGNAAETTPVSSTEPARSAAKPTHHGPRPKWLQDS